MILDPMAPSDPDFRTLVVAESIRLFGENGYESTTVEQIAAAAGISRRTFFRQFRAKEDVIFADHESLLAQVDDLLAATGSDPSEAVCAAAELVFGHFSGDRNLAFRRLQVVSEVPALRDRELVTTYRYQRAFEEFLRRRLPEADRVHIVTYVAAVTGAHNYLLRRMIRGDSDATLARLRTELTRIRLALGVSGAVSSGPSAELSSGRTTKTEDDPVVTVVTYPAGTSPEEITRHLAEQLGRRTAGQTRRQSRTIEDDPDGLTWHRVP